MNVDITINMDARCQRCGHKGATASGYCLNCVIKAIDAGHFDPISEKHHGQLKSSELLGKRVNIKSPPMLRGLIGTVVGIDKLKTIEVEVDMGSSETRTLIFFEHELEVIPGARSIEDDDNDGDSDENGDDDDIHI